jgi:carbonic anhydrase/acetyltransferase-like protein (isoleucine patch superfamily)
VAEDPGAGSPIVRTFPAGTGEEAILLRPRIDPSAWIAPGAVVVGDVTLGPEVSVWYGAVLRGDVERISIGARTNFQDQCTVHVTRGRFPTLVGDDVTVGHRAVIHGCTVGDGALIGIGAIVLEGATIGEGALVGAGAVVTPGTVVAPGALVMGVPARVVRDLTESERHEQVERARQYVDTARRHAAGQAATWAASEAATKAASKAVTPKP